MLLRMGTEGDHVAAMQQFLQDQQLYDGVIDGDFGKGTRDAVEMYQAAMNLIEDGMAGAKTLSSMGFDFAEHEEGDHIEDVEVDDFQIDGDSLGDIVNVVVEMYSLSVREDVEENILVGMQLIEPYLEDLHLDTRVKLALFFGQVRQEVGVKFRTIENLNYSCKALPKLFKAYRSNGLADKHGRCGGQKADQVQIANHAYANRIGNGDVKTGDGGLFRGAGCKQLTGRANYQGYHDWLEENLNDVYVEQAGDKIMEWGAEALMLSPHAFLSAVYFWHSNKLYEGAKYGLSRKASDHVTKIVNRHTKSYGDRWKHTMGCARGFGIL